MVCIVVENETIVVTKKKNPPKCVIIIQETPKCDNTLQVGKGVFFK